jgi:dolichyl-phosphate-mannose-protein mannosyltransferase
MASQPRHGVFLDEKKSRQSGKSPAQTSKSNGQPSTSNADSLAYTSVGVGDYDIFSIPASDWQVLGFITLLGAVVRLFRIYQPSSVVFDEVQLSSSHSRPPQSQANPLDSIASVDSLRNISRANSSWTFTLR